jgi:hypothetical protein
MKIHVTTALLVLTTTVAAQGGRVVPAQFSSVEGNSLHQHPFGQADSQLQILADARELAATQASILDVLFRAEGAPSSSYPAYTKSYKVTLYTTSVSAAQMTTDPVANRGTATGTIVFNGSLNVPASLPAQPVPRLFGLRIPFTSTYRYQAAQGNLLMHLETADPVPPPGIWLLDAVRRSAVTAEGLGGPVSSGCRAGADELRLAVAHAGAIVGGSLAVTTTSSRAGAFPVAFFLLGFTNQGAPLPIDLTALGMPNCKIDVEMFSTQVLAETAGAYPAVSIPVPNDPSLAYLSVFTQGFGWAVQNQPFSGSVTSAAHVTVIGEAQAPPLGFQSIHYVASQATWLISGNGVAYSPVFLLEGLFF